MENSDLETQITEMATHYYEILRLAGFDPNKGDLKDTPRRVAKAFLEMTRGHRTTIDDQMRVFSRALRDVGDKSSSMITLQGVKYVSLCEHHLLPFVGEATVAYIPDKKLIGLSKITRIVEYFSHRLQSEERMAHNIADFMEDLLKPLGVAVVITGKHTCSSGRGVEDHDSVMKMNAMKGIFLTDANTRAEFLSTISHA